MNRQDQPIKPSTAPRNRRLSIPRAPVEDFSWAPSNVDEFAIGLATIANEAGPAVMSRIFQDFASVIQQTPGSPMKEDAAIDHHVSIVPGGARSFTPEYDESEDEWLEDEVFPTYLRSPKELMYRRPDLALTYRMNDYSAGRPLPSLDSELTAVAYEYGLNVPKQMIASLWNRALTLYGEFLVEPEFVYDPGPVQFLDSYKIVQHPLAPELSTEPVVNPAVQSLGESMNKKSVTLREAFERVFEELVCETTGIPLTEDESDDGIVTLAQIGKELNLSTQGVSFIAGRALAKLMLLVSDEAQRDLPRVTAYAMKQFLDTGLEAELFDREDVEFMAENIEKTAESESFRNFLNYVFIRPVYLEWKNAAQENIRGILAEEGIEDQYINRILKRLDDGDFVAGTPEESIDAITKVLAGKTENARARARAKDLANTVYDVLKDTEPVGFYETAVAPWNKLSENRRKKMFVRAIEETDQ